MLKCKECDKKAEYIFDGYSYCKKCHDKLKKGWNRIADENIKELIKEKNKR